MWKFIKGLFGYETFEGSRLEPVETDVELKEPNTDEVNKLVKEKGVVKELPAKSGNPHNLRKRKKKAEKK